MHEYIMMTQSHGERIGDIGRMRHLPQTENLLHHPLHLLLARPSVARERFLYASRRVAHDRNPSRRSGDIYGSASVTHQDRGSGVVIFAVQFLNDHDNRSKIADNLGHAAMHFEKLLFKRVFVSTADYTGLDQRRLSFRGVDYSIAGGDKAWIDAYNPDACWVFAVNALASAAPGYAVQPPIFSIMSSGISKLE
jgi:hypothetical protein